MHSLTELLTGPERKALDRTRAQLDGIGRTIEETAGAPWPHDVIFSRMKREIDAQLHNARYWMRSFVTPGYFSFPDPADYVGSFALLWGEKEMETRLRALIKQMAPVPGLSPAEREAELSRLRVKERELLEQEERETCRLEARGFIVDRRRYPDVALLLETWESL
jgi:hypothetical protein